MRRPSDARARSSKQYGGKMEAVIHSKEQRDRDSDTRSHHCSTTTPKFLPHHINIMKVALALAIIRQKPEGVSSREYTERLALQFSELQVDWKQKAQQLQQELLRTRQELTKYQIQSETLVNNHNERGVQWSDSEWQSSGYSSSFQPTSQDVYSNQPTKQAHNEDISDTIPSRAERIAAHVKFLSSVSSVLNVRHNLSVLTESDLCTAVRDTLIDAISGLSEVLSSSCLPSLPSSLSNLEAAIQTVVDAIQAPRMRPFHAEIVEACENLLKSITGRLSQHQNTEEQSDALCSLLCTLSSLSVLFHHAVQYLTSAVVDCADMLSRSIQDISALDITIVESTAVIFRALERLLTKYDTSTLPQEMCQRLSGELESSVLNLTSAYPLFTYSVWTLLAHLAA